VWFGMLFVSNLQLGYVTPPFGMSLFYLKGIAPKEITLNDIYRSVWPFVLLEIIGIALMIKFPQLIIWIV
jgi:TRAP-type mannitol/chloroaromatic compound transport system permease large subunit